MNQQTSQPEHPFTGHLLTGLLAAKAAGDAILEVYYKDFAVRYKDDRSPLTLADQRAHTIIVSHLSDPAVVRYPILSEEGKDIPFEQRSKWEYFWLVDPLDGTKEFIKRNDEFTVNLALIHERKPILGVIFVPVRDVFYFGAEGLGAYKLDHSEAVESISDKPGEKESAGLLNHIISRSARLPLTGSQLNVNHSSRQDGSDIGRRRPFTIAGSRSHPSKALDDYVKAMQKKYEQIEFISAGSSLKLCLVAEGRADVYPRLGPTMEWDTAAGQIIVEQANGCVLDTDNDEPLTYNKENLLNPWFIVHQRPLERWTD
jgi:3'(2'), 5'-bisphosphate nucleotidase